MIDFHCHLDHFPEPSRVIDECGKQGLYVLSMTNTPSEWQSASNLVKEKPRLKIALGLHPQLVGTNKEPLNLFGSLINETRYIGEIGLDGSSEYHQHMVDQIAAFEHVLSTCQGSGGKIMSIHSRGAAQKVLNSLKKYPHAGVPVLHWFSGSMEELETAKAQGYWFSVGPAMFQSAKGRALVQKIPRDRITTETDGPYTRFQGKSIMPWDVSIVAMELVKLWGSSAQEVKEILDENIRRLLTAVPE